MCLLVFSVPKVVRMSEVKRWKVTRLLRFAIPILLVVYVLSTGPNGTVIFPFVRTLVYDRNVFFCKIISVWSWSIILTAPGDNILNPP